jgi:hypothetical protein
MHTHFNPGERSCGEIVVSPLSVPLYLAGPVFDDPVLAPSACAVDGSSVASRP